MTIMVSVCLYRIPCYSRKTTLAAPYEHSIGRDNVRPTVAGRFPEN